jgi:predicted transcriptional regulator
MPNAKINDTKLIRLVDEGKSQAEIARWFQVTRQAINKRLTQLRGKTTKAVVVKKVEEIVDRKLDAMDQLQKINDYANELLELLMRWNRGDEEALQILESQVTSKKVRVGDKDKFVEEIKMRDPRQLALQAMAEIRGQLKLQLEIFQALYDLKAVQEFQQEVLSAIGEASPEVRSAIISSLNQRRALRSAIKFA